jgi:hypothetical protein
MVRVCVIVLVGLAAAAPAAASWADSMFDGFSRDFGSVPRGPTLTHRFRLVNNTTKYVRIAGIRVSCGCVTAYPLQADLAPGQATAIIANMDTRRFAGAKVVTIYVNFDRPRREEVQLWVQANSRDDVVLEPASLAFGLIKRGNSPAAATEIHFYGSGQWQVIDIKSDSNYIQPSLTQIRREPSEVVYQLTARIRADAPVGRWYSDLWLQTNHMGTPRVRVPITMEIEAPLSVSPSTVLMGQLKAGEETERRVIIRGSRPFRIVGVKGADQEISVHAGADDSRPVHVLTVRMKPHRTGDVQRTLRIQTDMKDGGEVEFHAKAQVTGDDESEP